MEIESKMCLHCWDPLSLLLLLISYKSMVENWFLHTAVTAASQTQLVRQTIKMQIAFSAGYIADTNALGCSKLNLHIYKFYAYAFC